MTTFRGAELFGEDLELGLDIMNKGLPAITVSIDTQTLRVKTGLIPIGYPSALSRIFTTTIPPEITASIDPPEPEPPTKRFVDRLGVIGRITTELSEEDPLVVVVRSRRS